MDRSLTTVPAASVWKTAAASLLLFFVLCIAASGDPLLLPPAALIACLAGGVFLLLRPKSPTGSLPILLSVSAYVLWGMLSTFYAVSRKIALLEFSKWAIAFAVFLAGLSLLRRSRSAFRLLANTVSWTALFCGVLSVDAASSSFLVRGFRALMGPLTQSYAEAGSGFPSRLATIFENANTYAGLLSVAVLLSLWLLLTSESRAQRISASILTTVNSICYLLAFSMGSLFFFAVSCLLFLFLAKEKRLPLFLILLETALGALLAAGLSMPGLPRHPGGSFLPLAVLALTAALICLFDLFLRDRIEQRLQGHGKAVLILVCALVLLSAGYLIAALHLSSPYDVKPSDTLKRSADLAPGAYTLTVAADAPAQIDISYRNENALLTNRDLPLASGSTEAPCPFTVPEDAEIVFVRVLGETRVTDISYEGPESGSLVLRYTLLPSFIANRIQALGAPGTAIQRTGFWADGLTLFKGAPVLGNGLGCVESQMAGVRSYHYEIRQVHNHFVQMLADGGIVGLLLYLGIIGCAFFVLIPGYRRGSPFAAVLLVCCFQMFAQSITDVTWSAGNCLPVFFLILAMAAVCGPAEEKALSLRRDRILRCAVAAALLLYCIPLFGTVRAQAIVKNAPSFDSLQHCAAIDCFDANSHKLSYVLSSVGSADPAVLRQAEAYAEELSTVPSNTIPVNLARYRLATGDYPAALSMFDWAIECSSGDADLWNEIFHTFHILLESPNVPASVLDDLSAYQQRLLDWNAKAKVPHTLDAENALFFTAAAMTDPAAPETFPQMESSVLLDTDFSPDLDGDFCPDVCRDTTGTVRWDAEGRAHVLNESVFSWSFRPVAAGTYRLQVFCDDPASLSTLTCAGQEFRFTAAEGYACWDIFLEPDGSGALYDLSFTAEPGTVISRVAFLPLAE